MCKELDAGWQQYRCPNGCHNGRCIPLDRDVWTIESLTNISGIYQISKNDYFVLCKGQNTAILQYKGHSIATSQTSFELTNGDVFEEALTPGALSGKIRLAGRLAGDEFGYQIQNVTKNDQNITVDLNGDR